MQKFISLITDQDFGDVLSSADDKRACKITQYAKNVN